MSPNSGLPFFPATAVPILRRLLLFLLIYFVKTDYTLPADKGKTISDDTFFKISYFVVLHSVFC